MLSKPLAILYVFVVSLNPLGVCICIIQKRHSSGAVWIVRPRRPSNKEGVVAQIRRTHSDWSTHSASSLLACPAKVKKSLRKFQKLQKRLEVFYVGFAMSAGYLDIKYQSLFRNTSWNSGFDIAMLVWERRTSWSILWLSPGEMSIQVTTNMYSLFKIQKG